MEHLKQYQGELMAVYSTIWWDDGSFPDVIVLDRRKIGYLGVLKGVLRLNRGDRILLNGALSVSNFWFDMFLAIILKYKSDVKILISDATWNPRTIPRESRAKAVFQILDFFQKLLFRLSASKDTHFCFLSKEEINIVCLEAGVNKNNLHFTPFCHQLPNSFHYTRKESYFSSDTHNGVTIFAGGNSLRDYDTLIEAAVLFPNVYFVIATSNKVAKPVPSNVKIGFLNSESYFNEMKSADLIVVPLYNVEGRSVGQQTYLNALALGIPLIVSDVVGVKDYLEHKVNSYIVGPSNAKLLVEAISYFLCKDNYNDINIQVSNGLDLVKRHSPNSYIKSLLDLLAII
jgi:glycosyltransferase involved in cell wall biosynthesis